MNQTNKIKEIPSKILEEKRGQETLKCYYTVTHPKEVNPSSSGSKYSVS